MFQDPRAEKFERLQLSLSDRTPVGDDLLRQLLYGNAMHPSEALIRIEIIRAMGEQNAIYSKSIRRKQKRLGVSALEWRQLSYCGYSCSVPEISSFLNPTKQDVRVVREGAGSIIEFLDGIAKYFKVWQYSDRLSREGKYCWKEVSWSGVKTHLELCDWLSLHHLDTVITCLTPEGDYDRPTNRFTVCGYDFPPTADTGDREPWIWAQLNNDLPSV